MNVLRNLARAAPVFVAAWTAAHGKPEYHEQNHNESAPCRALPHVAAFDFPGSK